MIIYLQWVEFALIMSVFNFVSIKFCLLPLFQWFWWQNQCIPIWFLLAQSSSLLCCCFWLLVNVSLKQLIIISFVLHDICNWKRSSMLNNIVQTSCLFITTILLQISVPKIFCDVWVVLDYKNSFTKSIHSYVDEEASVFGSSNSGRFHENLSQKLLSRKYGISHKNFRPQKFGAIPQQYIYTSHKAINFV